MPHLLRHFSPRRLPSHNLSSKNSNSSGKQSWLPRINQAGLRFLRRTKDGSKNCSAKRFKRSWMRARADAFLPIRGSQVSLARRSSISICHRYRIYAWCVMPNHVHALFRILDGHDLAKILHAWKSFSSKRANRLLGRSGEFWQREYYDHLVRSERVFYRIVNYILENPNRAGLRDWKWIGVDLKYRRNEPAGCRRYKGTSERSSKRKRRPVRAAFLLTSYVMKPLFSFRTDLTLRCESLLVVIRFQRHLV